MWAIVRRMDRRSCSWDRMNRESSSDGIEMDWRMDSELDNRLNRATAMDRASLVAWTSIWLVVPLVDRDADGYDGDDVSTR